MRLTELDLNLLVVFEAVYREGTVTRAAKRVHLTQPALSHSLARLRSMLGDPLFVRSGRTMVPSPFARNLIGPVREALSVLEHGLFPGQAFQAERTWRCFHVGMREALEVLLLPDMCARVQVEAPGVQLRSVRVGANDLEVELTAGTIDAAADIELPTSAAIHHVLLRRDRLVMVVRPDHPVLREPLDLDRYLTLTHVLVSSRRSGPGLVDAALHRMGRGRRVSLRCQSDFAACHVVRTSDVVCTMPEQYAALVNRGLGNALVPLPAEVPPVNVRLYWHASTERESASRWLRKQLVRSLADAQCASEATAAVDDDEPDEAGAARPKVSALSVPQGKASQA